MTAILGLSAYYHDSAACLLVDGDLVAAAQEERFSRKKHDHAFPTGAITYCLEEGKLTPDKLDYVAFYDKPLVKFERLLETYLDRHHGENWRTDTDKGDTQAVPPSGPMSRQEAADILGVDKDTSNEEIKAAHRRLIPRLHSARGGSDYLATLINQARDVMIG